MKLKQFLRFTAIVRSNSASVISRIGFGFGAPALFRSTSSCSHFALICSTIAWARAKSLTSAWKVSVRLPRASISRAVTAISFSRRSTRAMSKPESASASAQARPMPRAPPVTRAVFVMCQTFFYLLSSAMLARVADHVGMGCAPDVALRLGQANELLDDPQTRAIADHVRMAGELEDSSLLIGGLEFAPEYIEHIRRWRVGTQPLEAMHHEIDRVVADPFHRKFDHAGRLAVEQQLVAIDVGHQRGIVEQAGLLGDAQRVRREIPGRGARADRPHPGRLLQHVGRAHHQILLGLIGKHRVQLVDP